MVKLEKTNRVTSAKTTAPLPLRRQGKYRWTIEYVDGSGIDKYNADGSKNVYASKDQGTVTVHVNNKNASRILLTNHQDDIITSMAVPDGAVVFQRRRVMDINYSNTFHDMDVTVPARVSGGRYIPEHTVRKRFPEYTYSEVWLIGWRKREGDGTVSLHLNAVYPNGTVESYTSWGVKPWLGEPEWFLDETLDATDQEAQVNRLAAKYQTTPTDMEQRLGWG